MTSFIVYGSEAGEGMIELYVNKIQTALKLYNINVKKSKLSDWDTQINDKKAVENDKKNVENDIKTVENDRKYVVYIASIDNEKFHTDVKPVFSRGLPDCMVILVYTPVDVNHVKIFKTSVKHSLKKKEPTKLKDTMDRIVCVTDLDNISQWWPQVLKLLVPTQAVGIVRLAREIGVFFKIDVDDETQVEWLEWQRNTLEKTFNVSCRYNDGLMSEEIYIKYSQCVVMYVDRKLYQRLRLDSARKKGKIAMLDAIKETRDLCSKHGTKFQIFVDEAGVKLTNTLATDYRMRMTGDGMLSHWLGLLSSLNLIRARRKPDTIFYSKVKEGDEQERQVFKSQDYRDLFPSSVGPREVTSSSRRHVGSLKGVSYQSADSLVVDLGGSIPRASAVCCNWLQSRD